MAGLEELRVGVELADRLVQAGRGDLDADARCLDRVRRLFVQPLDRLVVRAWPVVSDQVGVRERVEQPAPGGVPQPDEITPPGLIRAELLDEPRLLIDGKTVDEVDRAEQVVPRIGRDDVAEVGLRAREIIDLEAKLDWQAALLRLHHGPHVLVEIVDAALEHVLLFPKGSGLLEVVDVLGETDLIDATLSGGLDELLRCFHRVIDPLVGIAKVHVVVDDHRNEATSSRSAWLVTFKSRRSPGTVVTRPPRASTRAEQSVASARSPASASRKTGARNACGVCAAKSSSRGSVSTI